MRALLPLCLVALFALSACESDLDAPRGSLSLQTRDALEVLPAGAQATAMINLDAARKSNVLDAVTGGQLGVDMFQGESGARFDEFVRLTGFRPEEDIKRVYMASTGPEGDGQHAFVFYGDYNRERLDSYLDDQMPSELERTSYRDLPLYLVTHDEGRRGGFALVNDEMIVAGNEAAVRSMIDRLSDGAGGLSNDNAMMALIGRAAHPDGAWFIGRSLGSEQFANGSGSGIPVSGTQMDEIVVSLGFERGGVDVSFVGSPQAGINAADLADVIRGAVSAAKMQVKDDPALLDALDGVRVKADGNRVHLNAFADADVLAHFRDND